MSEKSLSTGYKSSETRYSASAETFDSAGLFYNKKIWRAKDVARFLQCSVGHVYNLVSDEKIPTRKKHGLLFFVPDEILNWILEGDEK